MEAKTSSSTIIKTMESADTTRNKTDSPAIELPKGGGAMRGISENFAANPVTGTSSFTIPLPISSARGFEPQIALAYDSGGGNGVFGLGWSLSLPSIARKTDKRLPSYQDDSDIDIYSLSGSEDLVPFLGQEEDSWQEKVNFINLLDGSDDITWEVKLYRPRTEGAFNKIERWRDKNNNRIWWRTVSATNISTVYGYHDHACLFEPGNRAKTFKWLVDFSYDDKGHVTRYVYQKDDDRNVDFTTAHELHRKETSHSQVYLKKVLYGIKSSRFEQAIDDKMLFSSELEDRDFLFQTVFDYGDHSEDEPNSEPDTAWPVRHDAFSTYRSGFEIRTYRRCQRALLFHDFHELGDLPELIRALKFTYKADIEGFSFLKSASTIGYKRDSSGVMTVDDSMPPIEFEYQEHLWNSQLQSVAPDSLDSLPEGVNNQRYQWVDLYGEGLSGVVSEHSGALYYRQNDGGAQLSPAHILSSSPSLKGFGTAWQFQDLEGNGIKSLVSTNGITRGYYQFDGEIEWENLVPFPQIPNIDFNDPNLRIIDLNGNGKPDVLISEERTFRWYPSKGKDGFDEANISSQPDGKEGPTIIFANEAESIFTADMTGDGLSDIVRIRNGNVVYWPNLGYGHFGAKASMSGCPTFDHTDQFTASHIRLADLDGSGTTDIIYLGKNEFRYWLNNCGNSWSEAYKTQNPFPEINNLNAVSVIDLLGTGTACVLWSSPLPANQGQHIRYIDLMGSVKPHLMKAYHNGFGKTVNLEYTPSTHFYLEDKQKGEPWVTRLHFPVHCLSKTETIDRITGARFVSSYRYHHGYYDHAEREFRGFGRVDQINSEAYEHFVKGGSSNVLEKVLHQTPTLVKTWFHTGAYLDRDRILNQYEKEYCSYDNQEYAHLEAFELSQPDLPEGLSPAEWREALRACKGMALRTETYGLDGTEKENYPFSIATATCAIRKIQPKSDHQYAVFQTLNTESIQLTLDRNPQDPRISQTLQLDHDAYGNPLLSAAINYGRRQNGPGEIQTEQQQTQCVVTQVSFTNDDYGLLGNHDFQSFSATFRTPVTYKNSTFELGVEWNWGKTKLSVENIIDTFTSATSVGYLRKEPAGTVSSRRPNEKRLLSSSEVRFANKELNDERAAGKQSPLGITWKSYQLAFTPALLSAVYGDKVDPDSFEGGYIDLHGDGNWWVPSGTSIFNDPYQIEEISDRFYVPFGSQDAFGAANWNGMDQYLLLPTSSSVSKAGYDTSSPTDQWQLNRTIALNDYRTLSPKYLRDMNDNWRGVETDIYGFVVKTAVMGKVPATDENTPPDDDTVTEGDNLANPSAALEYGFYDRESHQPAWVKTRSYTQHFAETGVPRRAITDPLQFLEQYEYSDGSGNVVMAKAQAEPGIAKQMQVGGSVVEVDTRKFNPPQVRWVGSGRTIVNNAGNPVKQYEPYFSVTHKYENAPELVETGITPILFYDAAGRNVCKLNPNKTYEKVIFDAWHQQSWDVNDNLYLFGEDGSKITDYTADPDVGHYFSGLESGEYSPSWYDERINGGRGADQQRAAEKTEQHVATPTESHTDSFGRTIYAIAHNRIEDPDRPGQYKDELYATRTHLDIEGNLLAVIDARDNTVMSYSYSMLPAPDKDNPKPALYQSSMDGGEKWTLDDIQGKVIKSWDSREHLFATRYDELNRPVENYVLEDGVSNLVGHSEYVDSDHPESEINKQDNLIGNVVNAYDQAGRRRTLAFDFKGNLLSAERTLAKEYKNTIDWKNRLEAQLEKESFTSHSTYDALNRVTRAESPHSPTVNTSIARPDYNESGALSQVYVSIHGKEKKIKVERIEYDAKGQRQMIRYGNGVETEYQYEADTYRLERLISREGNKIWQDLSYTYDPVGNITEIIDSAQPEIIHGGVQTNGQREYQYDPLYRLIRSTGREHKTQALIPDHTNGWERNNRLNPNELQPYFQEYRYDSTGNIEQMKHRRPTDNMSGWTRNYNYAENSNRLLSTTLGDIDAPFDEHYTYNTHGSITSMPHLQVMDWDFSEQLRHVDRQGGGDAYYVYDSNGQRTRKILEKSGSLIEERIYLGGWEIFRKRVNGEVRLERDCLHIMDDQKRIALIETKTIDTYNTSAFYPVIRYQLANHLGSTVLELGDAGPGQAVPMISYEEFHPYGTTAYHIGIDSTHFSAKRYRYTGKERDEETGFSCHEARYLIVQLGRWAAADPLGLDGGINTYAYASNNSLRKTDGTGLAPEDVEEKEYSDILKELSNEHVERLRAKQTDLARGDSEAIKKFDRSGYVDYLQSNVRDFLSDKPTAKRGMISSQYGNQKVSRNQSYLVSDFAGTEFTDALVRAADMYDFEVEFLAAAFFNEGIGEFHNHYKNFKKYATVSAYSHTGADHFAIEVDELKESGYLRNDFSEGQEYFDDTIKNTRQRVSFPNIESALEASTAMLARRRDLLSTDLEALGLSLDEITDEERAYWTYLYYNAGEAGGKKRLIASFEKNEGKVPVTSRVYQDAATAPFSTEDSRFNAQRVVANYALWKIAFSPQN